MRTSFHQDLRILDDQLVEMTGKVGEAMALATHALLQSDLSVAERVIASDPGIDAIEREIDDKVVRLMVQQAPMATDLRVLLTWMRMSQTLERMGDLARHVAKLARLRFPGSAVAAPLRDTFAQMATIDVELADTAGRMIRNRDLELATRIVSRDDAVDDLHRDVFRIMRSPEWNESVETTVDATLCNRYLERYADHAVSLAHRMEFLVHGARQSEG